MTAKPSQAKPSQAKPSQIIPENFIKNKILYLKSILPEVFCEDKIDWEKLKLVLGEDNLSSENERYQLNWAGKSAAYHTLQTPTSNTLAPCVAESVDFEGTQNLFIEAENLEALKILQKSYAGSVKMIYIDPPYNTGNDSFIYPDKFSENREEYARRVGDKDDEGYLNRDGVFQGVWRKNGKDSGHYHSNWLSMMLPRLHLAKTLLRDDGVIFISIDDNEQAQLKLLCDEVFGAENFVANVIWQKIHSTKNDAKYFSDSHEHITCYAKNILNLTIGLLPRTKEMNARFSNPDSDPRGDWSSGDLVANEERTGGYFNITGPTGKIFNVPQGKHWVYSETNLRRMINENRIWFGKNGDAFPRLKRYLSEVQQGRKVDTLWLSDEVGHNQESKREVKKIFDNQGFFDFPKPVRLIYRNLFIATSKDDLILDFFSGSATTAHAVMQLNAEDGGSRRCISIQLPEATDEQSEAYKAGYLNIAEIAKERIRRAGRQIAAAHPDKNIDTGFKVFKLAESHFKQWQSDVASDGLEAQLNMFIDPVAANALPENIAYELLLRLGLKLTARVWQQNDVFWLEDEGRRTALLLTRVDEALLDELTAQQPDKVVALDRLFDGNDALKTNAVLQMKEADIVFATV